MDDQILRIETEAECYGFTLEQLKLEGRLCAKIALKTSVDNFKNKLIEKLKSANASFETIEKINNYEFDDLCSNIFKSFGTQLKELDKVFDEEFLLENIYHKNNEGKESDEECLINEIREDEIMYMQNKYMLLTMQSELEKYKELEPIIKEETKMVKTLEKCLENFRNDFNPNNDLMTVHNKSNFDYTKSISEIIKSQLNV